MLSLISLIFFWFICVKICYLGFNKKKIITKKSSFEVKPDYRLQIGLAEANLISIKDYARSQDRVSNSA